MTGLDQDLAGYFGIKEILNVACSIDGHSDCENKLDFQKGGISYDSKATALADMGLEEFV